MGLRGKLALYVAVFVCVTIALVGYIHLQLERASLRDEMRRRGVALMQALSVPCAAAMANNDMPALDNYLAGLALGRDEIDLAYLAVLDIDGRVAAHTQIGSFGEIREDPFAEKAAASRFVVSRWGDVEGTMVLEIGVPIISGLRWGTLLAAFNLSRLEARLASLQLRAVLVGLLIALATSVVAFFVLSILVIQPVLAMERVAQKFGAGDLGVRFMGRSRVDEMGELGHCLNEMASRIQVHTESLERQVDQRTHALTESNLKLKDVNKQLENLARQDPLTGCANRRHFMEQLEIELERGKRYGRQFTIVMLDADNFKNYNDRNGHQAGDLLLTQLAELLNRNLRVTDLLARYGGEEFVILLPDSSYDDGLETATKLQRVVASTVLPQDAGQPGGKVTISVGLARFPADGDDVSVLLEHADLAMYLSKTHGRNRVSTWTDVRAKSGDQKVEKG